LNFYSIAIADALIDAKQRGVEVRVILDKTNRGNKRSQMPRFQEAGIEAKIDTVPGIAHNKVMIIDGNKVVTGLFNFSDSADTRNTENVVLIEDKDIAARYQENWMSRYARSKLLK
jgi:phospholipase D